MEEQQPNNKQIDTNIITISKNSKIIYKIYTKMNVLIKSAYGLLDETNYSLILTNVMKQLNKEKLFGFEKKELAICIMVLLLDSVGCPSVISKFTAEATVEIIEMIYTHNMHRYKQTGKCVVL
jgi:hypothetical protein